MDPPSGEVASVSNVVVPALPEIDETVTSCCICFVPDAYTDEDDPVLICEGCDVNVHMSCYGLAGRAVPKGDWFCELCRAGLQELLPGRVRILADLSVKLPAGAWFGCLFAPARVRGSVQSASARDTRLGVARLLLCADTKLESLKAPLHSFRARQQCPVCPVPSGMLLC